MDIKEQELIRHHRERIQNSTFDEGDILNLLILIREHAPKDTAVREFGDFVAHRRKDRGLFKDSLQKVKDYIDQLQIRPENQDSIEDLVKNLVNTKPIYSDQEIEDSLNQVFDKVGLPRIPSKNVDGIILCIMSLLQDVKFQNDKGIEIGTLLFAFNKEKVLLLGQVELQTNEKVLFPVLITDNTFMDFARMDERHILSLPNRLIRISNDNGKLKIISL